MIRGATSSFFGYIGFDGKCCPKNRKQFVALLSHCFCFRPTEEICCISGEAIDPTRNVPRAIIITLIVVTSLYCASSIGLAGMVPYEDISGTSGFPDGFRYRGYNWAADITAVSYQQVMSLPQVTYDF